MEHSLIAICKYRITDCYFVKRNRTSPHLFPILFTLNGLLNERPGGSGIRGRPQPIPASVGTADRSPAAGTSCKDDCAPDPRREPHSSCESCDAEFPQASLPFRKIPCVRPACPLHFPPRRPIHRPMESPKLGERDGHRRPQRALPKQAG